MKPLTIEQLKALKTGDWVWIIDIESPKHGSGYWQIHGFAKTHIHLNQGEARWVVPKALYGKDWIAYKNKEEASGDVVRLPVKPGDPAWIVLNNGEKSEVVETFISEVIIREKLIMVCVGNSGRRLIYDRNGNLTCNDWNAYVSREQAKARLKELRGEE